MLNLLQIFLNSVKWLTKQKYIFEGEIFQVVLSRLFKKKLNLVQFQFTEHLDI